MLHCGRTGPRRGVCTNALTQGAHECNFGQFRLIHSDKSHDTSKPSSSLRTLTLAVKFAASLGGLTLIICTLHCSFDSLSSKNISANRPIFSLSEEIELKPKFDAILGLMQ
jgi:hypothetical protein